MSLHRFYYTFPLSPSLNVHFSFRYQGYYVEIFKIKWEEIVTDCQLSRQRIRLYVWGELTSLK